MQRPGPTEPEILPPDAPGGERARRVRPAGWIGRNRTALLEARRLAAGIAMLAPPPARIPLALGCLAIEGVLLAEEARTGARDGRGVGLRAAALLLETGTLVAATRLAPAALARGAPVLVAARRVVARIEAARGR